MSMTQQMSSDLEKVIGEIGEKVEAFILCIRYTKEI